MIKIIFQLHIAVKGSIPYSAICGTLLGWDEYSKEWPHQKNVNVLHTSRTVDEFLKVVETHKDFDNSYRSICETCLLLSLTMDKK